MTRAEVMDKYLGALAAGQRMIEEGKTAEGILEIENAITWADQNQVFEDRDRDVPPTGEEGDKSVSPTV